MTLVLSTFEGKKIVHLHHTEKHLWSNTCRIHLNFVVHSNFENLNRIRVLNEVNNFPDIFYISATKITGNSFCENCIQFLNDFCTNLHNIPTDKAMHATCTKYLSVKKALSVEKCMSFLPFYFTSNTNKTATGKALYSWHMLR